MKVPRQWKARVFVIASHYRFSVLFEGKTRSLPLACSSVTNTLDNYCTKLIMAVRNVIVQPLVNDIKILIPDVIVIKLFTL
jgi:hypothetical protein